MALVPFTSWVCLRCRLIQRVAEPVPCCDDHFLIRVFVDDPNVAATAGRPPVSR
jgi:hypothetical protein